MTWGQNIASDTNKLHRRMNIRPEPLWVMLFQVQKNSCLLDTGSPVTFEFFTRFQLLPKRRHVNDSCGHHEAQSVGFHLRRTSHAHRVQLLSGSLYSAIDVTYDTTSPTMRKNVHSSLIASVLNEAYQRQRFTSLGMATAFHPRRSFRERRSTTIGPIAFGAVPYDTTAAFVHRIFCSSLVTSALTPDPLNSESLLPTTAAPAYIRVTRLLTPFVGRPPIVAAHDDGVLPFRPAFLGGASGISWSTLTRP